MRSKRTGEGLPVLAFSFRSTANVEPGPVSLWRVPLRAEILLSFAGRPEADVGPVTQPQLHQVVLRLTDETRRLVQNAIGRIGVVIDDQPNRNSGVTGLIGAKF